MALYNALITLAASAIQITDASSGVTTWPSGAMARRIFIEPLRGNSHAAYVGRSDVTNNGTGVAIQEVAAPVANVALDRYDDRAGGSDHNLDPTGLYVHGTSGEKLKVTLESI